MKKTDLRIGIEKKVVDVARKITEIEVNSTCPLIAYQAPLPAETRKLRKYKNEVGR